MILTLKRLKEVAELAAKHFPSCVIGGGAPRDAVCKVDAKDIDLFIDTRHMGRGEYEAAVMAFMQDFPGGALCTVGDPSIESDQSYDLHTADLPPIQLLPVSRCVFRDVFDYDFGLSQIIVTPEGAMHTARFAVDLMSKTLTYTKSSADPKSAERLKRLVAKYPERKLVNCEMLQA